MAEQAGKAMDKTKEQAGRVQQQSRGIVDSLRANSPNRRQLLGLATLVIGGATLAGLGGFMILATIVTLLLASPILLLLSPVLVPLGVVGFVVVATLAFVVSCAAGASWVYNYARGRHPVGSDQLEAARHRLMDTASQVTVKAREYGSYLQQKVQDVAPGA